MLRWLQRSRQRPLKVVLLLEGQMMTLLLLINMRPGAHCRYRE
jgi:predicted ATPase